MLSALTVISIAFKPLPGMTYVEPGPKCMACRQRIVDAPVRDVTHRTFHRECLGKRKEAAR